MIFLEALQGSSRMTSRDYSIRFITLFDKHWFMLIVSKVEIDEIQFLYHFASINLTSRGPEALQSHLVPEQLLLYKCVILAYMQAITYTHRVGMAPWQLF